MDVIYLKVIHVELLHRFDIDFVIFQTIEFNTTSKVNVLIREKISIQKRKLIKFFNSNHNT